MDFITFVLHLSDLRAQLEVDIQEVCSLAATLSIDREKLAKMKQSMRKKASTASIRQQPSTSTALVTMPPKPSRSSHTRRELQPYALSSDSEDDTYNAYNWEPNKRRFAHSMPHGDSISTISKELAQAVRKNFAMTLQKLMQHGLRNPQAESSTSGLIVPFMRCLNPSPLFASEAGHYSAHAPMQDEEGYFGSSNGKMHAWQLILEYYYLKHGDEYNNTPARKLSQSFNLDITDSQQKTPKQNLLSAIGMIISMHRPYKRSYNTHFKAFVCAALK